jgi:glycine dehydrogenase subunit 1
MYRDSIFISLSEREIKSMLRFLGISSLDELYNDIPREIIYDKNLNIPRLSEYELSEFIRSKLAGDRFFEPYNIYLGGGVWPVYIPSIVKNIISRSEFITSYTPYQSEISQGLMQALFEYESLMAELLDMDVVNCSMYDWATSIGEALLMACRVTKSNIVLIPEDIHRNREMVIKTYLWGAGIKYVEYPLDNDGNIDINFLKNIDYDKVACIYVEYPNAYGYIYTNLDEIGKYIRDRGGLLIFGVDPLSLSILKPPGYYDADIVVGEGQVLGNPMNLGGPLLGIFAVRGDMRLIRQMPGRIIGLTRSLHDDEEAFTMILQTREQHIKREKATSNICTNEALTALASAVYMSYMGARGLVELGLRLVKNSHLLHDILLNYGFEGAYELPFFREFSLKLNIPYDTSSLISKLVDKGILFGSILSRFHVVSINEFHSADSFEYLTQCIKEVS